MYVVDKENSIIDYVKQIKTVAAPDSQIFRLSDCMWKANEQWKP